MRERDPAQPDEDAELMERVGHGERAAFARLYDRNARAVVSFAYRFVQDRARAEELAQEIFLKVFRSAPSYQRTARFRTFLFRIAANHCLNERRRGEYRSEVGGGDERAAELPSPDRPDEGAAGRDLERALGEALAALPERERAAFVLCRLEGMPYREIAATLDTTEPAVKSLIHRATVAVAARLAPVVGANPLEAARARQERP